MSQLLPYQYFKSKDETLQLNHGRVFDSVGLLSLTDMLMPKRVMHFVLQLCVDKYLNDNALCLKKSTHIYDLCGVQKNPLTSYTFLKMHDKMSLQAWGCRNCFIFIN